MTRHEYLSGHSPAFVSMVSQIDAMPGNDIFELSTLSVAAMARKRRLARQRKLARQRFLTIAGFCALFAFVILPAAIAFGYAAGTFFVPDSAGPSYSLAHDIAGQRYIIDHDLTMADCFGQIRPGDSLSCIVE